MCSGEFGAKALFNVFCEFYYLILDGISEMKVSQPDIVLRKMKSCYFNIRPSVFLEENIRFKWVNIMDDGLGFHQSRFKLSLISANAHA